MSIASKLIVAPIAASIFAISAVDALCEPRIDLLRVDARGTGSNVRISARIRNGGEDVCIANFQFIFKLSDLQTDGESTFSGLIYEESTPSIPPLHIMKIQSGITLSLDEVSEVGSISRVTDAPFLGGISEFEAGVLNDKIASAMRSGKYIAQLQLDYLDCPVHGRAQELGPGVMIVDMPQLVKRKITPLVLGAFEFSVSHPE